MLALINVVLSASILFIASFMVFNDVRFTIRKRASKSWPTIDATVDGSTVGPQGLLHRVHFTYSYQVEGFRYTGRFDLLAGNTISVEELQRSVVGNKIFAAYDSRHPQTSFLTNEHISGRRVLQGPIWSYR